MDFDCFFLIVGILSVFVLSDEAYKLVGGSKYNELVSSGDKKISFSIFEKIKYIFSDEKTKEKMIAEKLELAESDGEDDKIALEGSSETNSLSKGVQRGGYGRGEGRGGGFSSRPKGTMVSSLNPLDIYSSKGHSNTSALRERWFLL